MNIPEIFSTKERVRILSEAAYREKPFGVSEIAAKAGLSKGLASKYLAALARERVLIRQGAKFSVADSLESRAARLLLNLAQVDTAVFRRHKFVRAAGLYGSCAKGANTSSSDVDIWAVVDKKAKPEELARFTSELGGMGRVNVLLLTPGKVRHLKESDPIFYYSLHFGSLVLHGDANEV